VLHIPKTQIVKLLEETRDKNYALLYQVFPGSFDEKITEEGTLHEYLRPLPLPEGSHAINCSLKQLSLQNVEVIAIRRGKRHLKPKGDIKLQAGDILILYGLPSHLDAAEDILLA